jgi:hypothetical protein
MTHFLAATKRVFNVQGAWHSPNVVGTHNGSRSRFQNCNLTNPFLRPASIHNMVTYLYALTARNRHQHPVVALIIQMRKQAFEN